MINPVQAYLDARPGETWYSLARQCDLTPRTLYKLLVTHQTKFLKPETMSKIHWGTKGAIAYEALEAWNRSSAE